MPRSIAEGFEMTDRLNELLFRAKRAIFLDRRASDGFKVNHYRSPVTVPVNAFLRAAVDSTTGLRRAVPGGISGIMV